MSCDTPRTAALTLPPTGERRHDAARDPVVHVRRHHQLVVACSGDGDVVLLLGPPDQDVAEVLHVARVALPARAYRAVERHLATGPAPSGLSLTA